MLKKQERYEYITHPKQNAYLKYIYKIAVYYDPMRSSDEFVFTSKQYVILRDSQRVYRYTKALSCEKFKKISKISELIEFFKNNVIINKEMVQQVLNSGAKITDKEKFELLKIIKNGGVK